MSEEIIRPEHLLHHAMLMIIREKIFFDDIEESDEEIEEPDKKTKKYMRELLKKYDDMIEKDRPIDFNKN